MTEAPKKVGWWRVDTHGAVTPPTPQRERYIQVYREVGGKQYIYCYGMTAKSSANTAANAENFARRTKAHPKGIIRDGGLEFEGEFRAWEESHGILEEQISGRYDLSETGGAESDVREVVLGGLTNLDIGATPGDQWLEACKAWCDMTNMVSGAWEEKHGTISFEKILKAWRPF